MASDAHHVSRTVAPRPFHKVAQDVRFIIYEVFAQEHCNNNPTLEIELSSLQGSFTRAEEFQPSELSAMRLALAIPRTQYWAEDRRFAFRAVYKRSVLRLVPTYMDGDPYRTTLKTYDDEMNAIVAANPDISAVKVLRFSSMHHVLVFLADVLQVRANRTAGTFIFDNAARRHAFANVHTVIVDLAGPGVRSSGYWHHEDLPSVMAHATIGAKRHPRYYWDDDHRLGLSETASEVGIKYTGQQLICPALISGLRARLPHLRAFAYTDWDFVWVRPLHVEIAEGKQSMWRRSPVLETGTRVTHMVKRVGEGTDRSSADCVCMVEGDDFSTNFDKWIQCEDFDVAMS